MDFSLLFSHFPELTITGLAYGAIYALIALGYTLVYGVLRLINFAHSEVFMYGAFAAVWVLMALGGGKASGLGIAGYLLIAFLSAMTVSALIALLLERVAYRPLRKRNSPPLIALISAIGASFALSEAMGLRDKPFKWFGQENAFQDYVGRPREASPFPLKIDVVRLFSIGNYQVSNIDLIVLGAAIVMMIVLDQFVNRSRLGRGIRAVAQDPEAAALMGVNRDRVIRLTFVLGGAMAGAAAVMYLLKVGQVRYNSGFLLGVKAFTAAVLGGIGNLRGALLGGFILGVAENYGQAVFGGEWRDVVAFTLLVVILLFRPTGLLGESLGKARA
ncbi:branched-chain amino acid ABC transporter permease [Knoellia koreensis]|jgi:branched-chain amino acid transport system permease protein|uniref:Branched-chain amino acid ABC transporter permease n=1 Tax=Knoellia koreensis TaxID=2730921 RepID=A0A849HBQ6_9MICO|nr:branched-chain amino acid ABC transporter permease [Knoellia sp. DB2414S]NNM44828.1 branched-chain amino acid ABC transporter permease [Knoellia sp. DB2414S]